LRQLFLQQLLNSLQFTEHKDQFHSSQQPTTSILTKTFYPFPSHTPVQVSTTDL